MRPKVGLLAGLFLGALALRPQLVGAGPLLPRIQDDFGISHAYAGLLGTIPVLCMGLFAPPAAFLAARFGSRGAIGLALVGIAAFGAVRAIAPQAWLVVALTFPVGVGMGLAGALMPVAVKERFAARPAFATGVYVTGINLGSAISSAAAVPLAHLGSWRTSFLVYAAAAGGSLVAWLVLSRREPMHVRTGTRPVRLPWHSGIAWILVAVFALMGSVYYGLNSWLPDAYIERGWSDGRAGALLAVLNACALPFGFLIPWCADRWGSRRLYLTAGGVLLATGTLGFAFVPGGGFAWAALSGIAIGGMFPLVMTLPLDLSDGPAAVGATAGLMLGGGYVLCAISPFALGAFRDATGSFRLTLWLIAAAAIALLATTLTLRPERLRARPLTP